MILFAKLQATHDERTGSFGIVVTHLFANVIFKASVAVRSAAQSAYLPPSFIVSGTTTVLVFLTTDTRVTVPLPFRDAFVILYL